jgi:hypothetical protein
MSKLTLAALVSGLALSLASPVFVQAAAPAIPGDADQPTKEAQSKKGITPKADTRSEKTKAASTPKDADQPTGTPSPKKDRAAKPDTRSEKAKAAGSTPKDADQPTGAPESKPKNK